ncbi:ABC transporter, iron(III) dicitrate-binding protein [Rivularia sp. IAM M-261]|nr:ABC transporter, iron(III) dicitrate-binding protein [Rivularia sp. IAM M-261]
MAFSSFLFAACHHSVVQKQPAQVKLSDCRFVQHKLGETCVPPNPQRIIALGVSWTLDPVLALGLKPVATSTFRFGGREYFPGLSDAEVAGIETVGSENQPSLERVLKLKPDLIIALDLDPRLYVPISTIAPTVVREFEKIKFSFKENFRSIAQLLNREEEAERVLARYEEKAARLRRHLESQSQKPEVSVIYYVGGSFQLPASEAICFQVLNDLNVRIKPVFLNQSEYVPLSIEVIHKYDADILFIVDFNNKPSSYFLQNALVASLKSARNKQAYIVKADTWFPYGPLGVDKLLDELPKYLLDLS